MRAPPRTSGFTLLEVMLALVVLAILTGLSWQGIATLLRTRDQVQTQVDQTQARELSMAQWRIDWQHLWSEPSGVRIPALQWDGKSLMMVRQSPQASPHEDPGLQVVAWTVRNGQWWRWSSTPLTRQGELSQAWQAAQLWAQQNQASEFASPLVAAQSWRVLFHRGGAWTHPASSSATSGTDPSAALGQTPPDAIRLELEVTNGQRLNLDVASPTLALERP